MPSWGLQPKHLRQDDQFSPLGTRKRKVNLSKLEIGLPEWSVNWTTYEERLREQGVFTLEN